ncbi:hypothetical protein AAFF_G00226530 [Aldrovandia affinis]|uniref:Cadherin-1 n=1 Tax=Aldrovandia affinis TaxID=143900 RepID=A0AAD7X2E8_9TELE|nr:hypothetical protein AAFF_G00226530 [Aldrovandia affinis]
MWGIKPFGFTLLLVQGWAMGILAERSSDPQGDSFEVGLVFKVERRFRRQGRVLGKEDSRFNVVPDGAVSLKRAVNLYDEHKSFSLHAWSSKGQEKTAAVTVTHKSRQSYHNHQREGHNIIPEQHLSSSDVLNFPLLWFPPSSGHLKRRKRDWVIPPINIPENDRGPFPKAMVQIKSSNAKTMEITYSIMGPGAEQPPEGVFTIDKRSGMLFVTKPLDREKKDAYMLLAHAVGVGIGQAEEPMELVIRVIDQNDNKPEFTHNPFLGHVIEGALPDSTFMKVTAVDKDDPSTDNAIVRYTILSQEPELPSPHMFAVNAVSGAVSVTTVGLDRETHPEYKLVIQATDMEGNGLSSTCTAIITVTDSNDNAPQFVNLTYSGSVHENVKGVMVVKIAVTDKDEPHTPAWSTKYTIIKGNEQGLFSISTGPGKMEGIITTAKGLDFENKNKHTLLVTVENDAPFATRLLTSTATVTVNVEDVNEAPIFSPAEKVIKVSEGSIVGSDLTEYRAKDPDSAMKQTVRFQIEDDPARWLDIIKETAAIKVKSPMDRESSFVKDGKYKATILAYDNGVNPATGGSVINLTPKRKLDQGDYHVVMRLYDAGMYFQDSTVLAEVCHCKGSVSACVRHPPSPHTDVPLPISVLGAVLGLLLLVLLLLMFLRRRSRPMREEPVLSDDVRDNLYYYDEEGGGEEDQEYDLSQLHRGLDNRPDVFRNDVAPTLVAAPLYRPRPEENEEIGNFIEDNLKAADNDPTAPPYDSLLVFDYEGGGSEAGSLSSLNSSSSGGDQDYDCLGEWGPRFKKLADMYCSGEDCDSDTLPCKVVWV